MAIQVKEFDTMVNDVLRRITNSTKISNINPGSVMRTIAEAILAEQDIQYYQIDQIFKGMDIDTATGNDLDRLVKILGVVRKSAVPCVATLTFGRSEASDTDIMIPTGSKVSTYADQNGMVTEFMVTQSGASLPAGKLSVQVECTAVKAGNIYVPANTVTIMNSPILNIEYVNNDENIYGGSDVESDDEFRSRSKEALSLLGKGTIESLESSVMEIEGVQDAICVDLARGVGTADIIVVTATLPPTDELKNKIEATIDANKAAGIDVQITYPDVVSVDINVNTIEYTDANVIGNGILQYILSLGAGDSLIINQLERFIFNACGVNNMDITVISPTANVTAKATQIIRNNTITINGVVWNE